MSVASSRSPASTPPPRSVTGSVQAVEDELVTFDATEVFLLTRGGSGSAAAEQLREFMRPRFHHVDLRWFRAMRRGRLRSRG